MNILILYKQGDFRFKGGIHTYVQELKKSLDSEENFNAVIYDMAKYSCPENQGRFSVKNVVYNLLNIYSFLFYISNKKFDIIHIKTSCSYPFLRDLFLSAFLKVLKRKRKVFLHIQWDVNMLSLTGLSSFYHLLMRILPVKYIVLSQKYKSELNLNNEKVFVLNNFSFIPIVRNESEILQLKKKVVLFVGSIDRRKNINKILKLFLLSNLSKEWKFIVVGRGQGKYFQEFLKLSNMHSSSIKYESYVDSENISGFYDSASLFILPSLIEGQPISAIEAMSRGCIVMLTKGVACNDEMLNSVNKYLLNLSSDEEIILQLNSFDVTLKDLRSDMLYMFNNSKRFSVKEHLINLKKIYTN